MTDPLARLAAALGPKRFLREVTIAANLQHPHILPLHDSGEADGFLYYVMPLVDGISLREKLVRDAELPIPDAVRILRDLADAMAYLAGVKNQLITVPKRGHGGFSNPETIRAYRAIFEFLGRAGLMP